MARKAQVVFMMYVCLLAVVVSVGDLVEAFVVSEIVSFDIEVLFFLSFSRYPDLLLACISEHDINLRRSYIQYSSMMLAKFDQYRKQFWVMVESKCECGKQIESAD
jgi:hypothetical protein